MKYITFDTSWLEKIQFDFSYAAFRCIQYTDYKVVISQVVDEEIRKHLLKAVVEFANGYNGSLKKMKFLSGLGSIPAPIDVDELKDKAMDSYSTFKSTIRAQIIPYEFCDLTSVFDNYFETNGVFQNSGKKNEFPDAVAVNSILNYIKKEKVDVFTNDKDWINAFKGNEFATIYTEKKNLLDLFEKTLVASEFIDSFIDEHKNEFAQHLIDCFEDGFPKIETLYPDEYCLENLEIDDFDCNFKDYTAIEIISKDTERKIVVAAIHFLYDFSAEISFDDDSMCSYDREDDIKYNVLRKHQFISGNEAGYCYIEFSFEDDSFGKINGFNLEDVEFCLNDVSKYSITEKPVEEEDYFDTK